MCKGVDLSISGGPDVRRGKEGLEEVEGEDTR